MANGFFYTPTTGLFPKDRPVVLHTGRTGWQEGSYLFDYYILKRFLCFYMYWLPSWAQYWRCPST